MGTSSSSFRAGARALLGVSLALAAGCSVAPSYPTPSARRSRRPCVARRRATSAPIRPRSPTSRPCSPAPARARRVPRPRLGPRAGHAARASCRTCTPAVGRGQASGSGERRALGLGDVHYGRWTLARIAVGLGAQSHVPRRVGRLPRPRTGTSDGRRRRRTSSGANQARRHGDAAPFVYVRAKDFASNELGEARGNARCWTSARPDRGATAVAPALRP